MDFICRRILGVGKKMRGPKKLVIGREFTRSSGLSVSDESLRWLDIGSRHRYRGLNEPPIRLLHPAHRRMGKFNRLATAQARWTSFICTRMAYSATELWPAEGAVHSTNRTLTWRAHLRTPLLVENTEVLGPSVLTLYLSTTDTDALLFVTMLLRRSR